MYVTQSACENPLTACKSFTFYTLLTDNQYWPPKLLFETLQHRLPIYLIKLVDNTKIPLHSYIGIHVCLFFPGAS